VKATQLRLDNPDRMEERQSWLLQPFERSRT